MQDLSMEEPNKLREQLSMQRLKFTNTLDPVCLNLHIENAYRMSYWNEDKLLCKRFLCL